MGAWGSSLYANDTSCDVRDTYMNFLKDQLSSQEAHEKTLDKLSDYIADPYEAPLFWYALADTQWTVGRLIPEVKEKALEWISKGGGIELWEESKSGSSGWQKTLEKLRIKLETEQPKEKKISKRINQNLWNIGDVYAYQFHTDESKKYGAFGKYMALQKINEEPYTSEKDLIMRVHVFDELFDNIPKMEDLSGVRLLPLDYPNNTRILHMNNWLKLIKKKEYPADYLTFIGNMLIPGNTVRRQILNSAGFWRAIDEWSKYFHLWQDKKYETTEEGVFVYTHQEQ